MVIPMQNIAKDQQESNGILLHLLRETIDQSGCYGDNLTSQDYIFRM